MVAAHASVDLAEKLPARELAVAVGEHVNFLARQLGTRLLHRLCNVDQGYDVIPVR